MSNLTRDDFPLGEWREHDTARHACGALLEIRRVLQVKASGFSLAGVQTKFPAREGWEYRCTPCGESGLAELK